MTPEEIDGYEDYLKKGGIYLRDISESLVDASTGQLATPGLIHIRNLPNMALSPGQHQ